MKLIADSGSTKTDWALTAPGQTLRLETQGLNPIHQDEQTTLAVLREELLPGMQGQVPTEVFFYGAGCNAQGAPRVASCLRQVFPGARVEVESDLLGAARALCGDKAGFACILGTGSNTCLYNGKRIERNIPPLGYILGDEGSGAHIGKVFLNHILKNENYCDVKNLFYAETKFSYAEIIDRIYRYPMANRFLASLVPFIHKHKEEYAELKSLVVSCFKQFFEHNIVQYHQPPSTPVNCVGGIAAHFGEELREAAESCGCRIGKTLERPMEGLLDYHAEQA